MRKGEKEGKRGQDGVERHTNVTSLVEACRDVVVELFWKDRSKDLP